MERIQELLLAHERVAKREIGSNEASKDAKSKNEPKKDESNVLELENITAAWPETKEPVLKDLNLTVEKGALIGIIGQVRDHLTASKRITILSCLPGTVR